jgi:hypothetical protein
MGADLLPGDPGRPQSLNPYSYTENNPPNAVDPFGLSSWDVTTTNGNCIVVSTYNNVEVKDKTGNWTNHTVLIGTQTTCAGAPGGSPDPPGGPDPGKGGKDPKPKKDPKKEDSEACKAQEALRDAQKETDEDFKHAGHSLVRDVKWGAGVGCAMKTGPGDLAGAATGAAEGGVPGAVVGGAVGGAVGCAEGGVEGGAVALIVWGIGTAIDANNAGKRSKEAEGNVQKECK